MSIAPSEPIHRARPERVVFNGRFLTQAQTGVQRYAVETLLALDAALAAQQLPHLNGVRFQLAVPANATPLRLQCIETVVLPWLSGHLWEQTVLPWFARQALVIGFSYCGPVVKRRQLITVHDATVAVVPECFSPRYRWFHNLVLGLLHPRVDAVMTVSEFSRGEIARHFGVARPVTVGREGWEHCIAGGDDAAVLQRHGLSTGGYVFLVGSLKPNKNLALIPRALAMLDDFPLTVAVAGSTDPRVFQRTADLPDSIRLLGFVPDGDLGVLYKHAAWFLFPSLYEGFGLPAVEAMANGCPVLAAHAGSLPEVCGNAALYFDPLDPASLANLLRRVATEPDLRAAQIARHADRLATYTWHQNAMILGARMSQMLGRSGTQAPPAVAGIQLERHA